MATCGLGRSLDPVELDRATFEPYVEGLRRAGCDVDATAVRRGVLAASLARWSFLLGPLPIARDPERRAEVEQRTGVPYREHVARVGRRLAYLQGCARELEHLS